MTNHHDPDRLATIRQALMPLRSVYAANITAPQAVAAMAELGLEGQEGYFATRAGPLGIVPAEVVRAAFYGHSPAAIAVAIPGVWDKATPSEVLSAVADSLDASLGPVVRELGGTATELIGLLRTVAERASTRPEGRALLAANAALPWPDEPHRQLSHAHVLLREWRGDGHLGTLLTAGLTGIEALVVHAAWAGFPIEMITRSRVWTPAETTVAVEGLRARGWLSAEGDPVITDEGRRRRDAIEDATDELDALAWIDLSDQEVGRLCELAAVVGEAVAAAVVRPAALGRIG
ncbi:MAG TPA: hypothetical protein VGH94_05010 [Acidimicrobiales bacterium]